MYVCVCKSILGYFGRTTMLLQGTCCAICLESLRDVYVVFFLKSYFSTNHSATREIYRLPATGCPTDLFYKLEIDWSTKKAINITDVPVTCEKHRATSERFVS